MIIKKIQTIKMTVMRKFSFILATLTLTLIMTLVNTSCTHENIFENANDFQVIKNAVKDVDGNKYDALKIGNQVWMQNNLRTTRFRDGSAINKGESSLVATTIATPYYYKGTTQVIPAYDEKTYGLYYNWAAVNDVHGLCPKGWHVPSRQEWYQMIEYVGSKSEYVYAGIKRNIAKALASKEGWVVTEGWTWPGWYAHSGTPIWEPESNNATGFTGVPACWLEPDDLGWYPESCFWSSTETDYAGDLYGHAFCIDGNAPDVFEDYLEKYCGLSVRCVHD